MNEMLIGSVFQCLRDFNCMLCEKEKMNSLRENCYSCMRPQTSCMCAYLSPVATNTHFVILMHPMEYKKEKNGTGRLTHLQLTNSQIIVGVDFTKDKNVNNLLNDRNCECFILYPGKDSINLSNRSYPFATDKNTNVKRCIFIIDGTWPCARKMLKLSENLHSVQKISFDNTETSKFLIKQQPAPLCLSTIESTLKVINLLKEHGIEDCDTTHFTEPFQKMIEYQVKCIVNPHNKSYRTGKAKTLSEKNNYKKDKGRNLFFTKS